MNYQSIVKDDLVNGEGVRCSLFVSGCSLGCIGCFNKKAWDYRSGTLYTDLIEDEIMIELSKSYISGLSLLGGDPLMPKNFESVLQLCKKVLVLFPTKNIWCWSGYTLDEIKDNHANEILQYIDVLVAGRFVESEKNLKLPFRGSNNQVILKRGIDF